MPKPDVHLADWQSSLRTKCGVEVRRLESGTCRYGHSTMGVTCRACCVEHEGSDDVLMCPQCGMQTRFTGHGGLFVPDMFCFGCDFWVELPAARTLIAEQRERTNAEAGH